jgi:hypothetical protein
MVASKKRSLRSSIHDGAAYSPRNVTTSTAAEAVEVMYTRRSGGTRISLDRLKG